MARKKPFPLHSAGNKRKKKGKTTPKVVGSTPLDFQNRRNKKKTNGFFLFFLSFLTSYKRERLRSGEIVLKKHRDTFPGLFFR